MEKLEKIYCSKQLLAEAFFDTNSYHIRRLCCTPKPKPMVGADNSDSDLDNS